LSHSLKKSSFWHSLAISEKSSPVIGPDSIKTAPAILSGWCVPPQLCATRTAGRPGAGASLVPEDQEVVVFEALAVHFVAQPQEAAVVDARSAVQHDHDRAAGLAERFEVEGGAVEGLLRHRRVFVGRLGNEVAVRRGVETGGQQGEKPASERENELHGASRVGGISRMASQPGSSRGALRFTPRTRASEFS
jgi:hypothetical protein